MKKIIFLFCFVIALVLTGCSGTALFLFNNTGQNITVISYDSVGVPFERPIAANEILEFPSPTKLVIKFNGGFWEYPSLAPLNKAYRNSGGFFRIRNYKFQIEKNGVIYLLLTKTKTIVESLPVQPEHFPLRPLNK